MYIFMDIRREESVELAVIKVCKRMAELQLKSPESDLTGYGGLMSDEEALDVTKWNLSSRERDFYGRCVNAGNEMNLIKFK